MDLIWQVLKYENLKNIFGGEKKCKMQCLSHFFKIIFFCQKHWAQNLLEQVCFSF